MSIPSKWKHRTASAALGLSVILGLPGVAAAQSGLDLDDGDFFGTLQEDSDYSFDFNGEDLFGGDDYSFDAWDDDFFDSWGDDSYGWGDDSYGWGDDSYGWGDDLLDSWGDDSYGWGDDGWGDDSYGWGDDFFDSWGDDSYGWGDDFLDSWGDDSYAAGDDDLYVWEGDGDLDALGYDDGYGAWGYEPDTWGFDDGYSTWGDTGDGYTFGWGTGGFGLGLGFGLNPMSMLPMGMGPMERFPVPYGPEGGGQDMVVPLPKSCGYGFEITITVKCEGGEATTETTTTPEAPTPEAPRPEAPRTETPRPEAPRTETPAPEGGAAPQRLTNQQIMEKLKEMHTVLNSARREAGATCALPPVNKSLVKVAVFNSKTMGAKGEANAEAVAELAKRVSYAGEVKPLVAKAATAEEAVKTWTEEAESKAILADCTSKSVGLGYGVDASGMGYWTVIFGSEE